MIYQVSNITPLKTQIPNSIPRKSLINTGLKQDTAEFRNKNINFGSVPLKVPFKEIAKAGNLAVLEVREAHNLEIKENKIYDYFETIRSIVQRHVVIDKNKDLKELIKDPDDALKLRFEHELSGSAIFKKLSDITDEDSPQKINAKFKDIVHYVNKTALRFKILSEQRPNTKTTLGADKVFNLAMQAANVKAKQKNIRISVENTDLLKEHINSMQGKDRECYDILSNLFLNAVKYSPKESNIKAGFSVKNKKLHFYIQDEGIGILPKDHEKVLNHERGTNVGNIHGSGFGLMSISYILQTSNLPKLKIISPLNPEVINPGSRFECFLPSNCQKEKSNLADILKKMNSKSKKQV